MNADANPGGGAPQMSAAEAQWWEEAANDLQPHKMLHRAWEHQKAIVNTVATVGTLLAGLGGVAAVITTDRSTVYWGNIPVLPVATLIVSALAGSAVFVSLLARRPTFQQINIHNMIAVRDYVRGELSRSRSTLKLSSVLLLTAAGLAVLTALATGVQTVTADHGPRNLASLSASVGAEGEVTVTLSGAVDRLSDDHHVQISVRSATDSRLIDATIHPDETGKAVVSATAQAPVGSSDVIATLLVIGPNDTETDSYTLQASYPAVPATADKSD